MAAVRRVLNVGLSARSAARVTGRQPLAHAVVRVPADTRPWIEAYRDDLADELNVESLEVVGDADTPAEPAADGAADGWVSASDRDVAVALDTRVTPALWRKGVARAVVHHVQDLRKHSGLRVDDRIHVTLAAPPDIAEAVAEHREHVCAETLAVSLVVGEVTAGGAAKAVTVEGIGVRLGLTRATPATD
jgi:isoleucyl-tRNA synthetase